MKKIEGIEPANYIQLELFPAYIMLTSGTNPYSRNDFKVIVTDAHFYAILDSVDGPYLEIKESLVDFDGSTKEGYTVETENNTYSVQKEQNCACGSRLRGVHPFLGIPHTAHYPSLRKK